LDELAALILRFEAFLSPLLYPLITIMHNGSLSLAENSQFSGSKLHVLVLNNESLLVREKSSWALAVPFIGRCQCTSLHGIMS